MNYYHYYYYYYHHHHYHHHYYHHHHCYCHYYHYFIIIIITITIIIIIIAIINIVIIIIVVIVIILSLSLLLFKLHENEMLNLAAFWLTLFSELKFYFIYFIFGKMICLDDAFDLSVFLAINCSTNSFWPSDTIWQQRSVSTLAQVMACCLTAPSHYLNQCWLIISEVQWLS